MASRSRWIHVRVVPSTALNVINEEMTMNVYEVVAERIKTALASGSVPWRQPWSANRTFGAVNIASGRPYRGINRILLGMYDYQSPFFGTYRQIQAAGGHVRAGEMGMPVVFYKMMSRTNASGDVESFPLFRYTTAFNIEQCENVKVPKALTEKYTPAARPEAAHAIAAADAIVRAMPNPPKINFSDVCRNPAYTPSTDTVSVPPLKQYAESDSGEFYSTLFHELAHSTGAKSRLNRESVANPTKFAGHAYGVEELVAEMTSSFLCNDAGIDNTLRNSAAYIGAWLKTINETPKILVQAASRAQKAADYIHGIVPAAH